MSRRFINIAQSFAGVLALTLALLGCLLWLALGLFISVVSMPVVMFVRRTRRNPRLRAHALTFDR
jgi:type IV secretory pathway TrbD component